MRKKIILLGATGSVGDSVLNVLETYPDRFELTAFSAWTNIEKTVHIIKKFSPKYVALQHKHDDLALMFPNIHFFYGNDGISELIKTNEADTVVSAILGTAGFLPALEALKLGKTLITANKESLVAGGKFLIEAVQQHKGQIIPLDSEHLAIFDLLRGKDIAEIKELVITASGGPFFKKEINAQTTIEEVLAHPTWKMGANITVGSALMINKGLEIIEAMRLFQLPEHKIRVLVHPQSIIHGALNTKSGHWHLLASPADMRYPALHSLFYPEFPYESPFGEYDPTLVSLEFFEPDYAKFPLLALARQVAREDGILPTVLCASMEVTIEKFLEGRIKFYKIPEIIQEIIEKFTNQYVTEIEQILIADKQARIATLERITFYGNDLR
ncbi:MAG: 1-deoxy-D-xylulose-5-phosphate reductoisomerase [Brevinema sp.]